MTRCTSRRTGYLTLCSALFAACGMLPGTALAAPAGLSAAQIVERNAAARGGEAAWRKILTVQFIGKMDAARQRPALRGTVDDEPQPASANRHKPGQVAGAAAAPPDKSAAVQIPYRLELKRPHKSRVEIDFQGQTAVQVYDGRQGWKLRPFLGQLRAEPYTADELKLAANEPQLDGLLLGAVANGTRISADGSESVEGRPTYRLKLQLKNGDVRHIWVDSKSFLETRVDGTRRFNGKARTTYTYFRDYRLIDGVNIPFLLETTIEGQHSTDKIVIDKVVVNPDLPDARFAMPLPRAAKSAAVSTPLR